MSLKKLSDCRLYTFIDMAYTAGRSVIELTRQLCEGGSDIIQLRAKNSSADEVRALTEKILPITEACGVWLTVNDHPKLTMELGAPLCHMGQEDFFEGGYTMVDQVTGCPRAMRLGLSTHTPDQAERALRAGPDYIAIGPVFATPTKPGRPPVTLDYVRWAKQNVGIPWFAIGGINMQNIDKVLEAGARRICVVSAILNAHDVAAECAKYRSRVDAVR
ncbi:MAG: thiamine phosphate synthase [Verrucomicrobiales bacterium]|nr:thiamine phosphate synthase [Verrucomicrobiales bacterium]|tara:strand:- start:10439 stop:11092 length:654 start_codon:yes stop_codon:yes gene_type:complete